MWRSFGQEEPWGRFPNPYVRWSTIFQSNANQPIQFNLNWTRIGKNCQSITNTGEMTRIGISPNLCQFWANPGKIYQCDDINCQFPANQTQRNLTAHRQVWASNLWHEPSCNWSLTDPEKFIANPENFNANPAPISRQSITTFNLCARPMECQLGTNQPPMSCQSNVNAWP